MAARRRSASSSERSSPRLKGESIAACRISSTRVGPRLRAEVGERLLAGERLWPQQLHPRALPRAELAQPQLAVPWQPQADAHGPVAHGGALVEELEAA